MILQERTTGEGNSLQDRSEAKVEQKYHSSESLLCTDEFHLFAIRNKDSPERWPLGPPTREI
jgi:hypothetical protein